ncbi:DUF4032 domain-containing protein [bacterium]|nr:DUF4032 domain-containing protein [bacterium]
MPGLSSCSVEITNSLLYKEFLKEREEILKNKWYMSEKEGRDVGFERALIDWVSKHRTEWKKHN